MPFYLPRWARVYQPRRACGIVTWPPTRYDPTPRPLNERQALEQERVELPDQIIAHQAELAATPAASKGRRERLDGQIRNLRKRLVEVEARLAAIGADR
jgi:hypothetical protein